MSQWPCVDEESQCMLKHSSVTFVCILVNLMNFSDAFIVCACLWCYVSIKSISLFA